MAKNSKAGTQTSKTEKQAVALGLKKEMTTVSFRVDKLMKKKAESLFGEMGLTMSAALNMFLAQAVRERGMPFQPNAQRQNGQSTAGKELASSSTTSLDLALDELWDEI